MSSLTPKLCILEIFIFLGQLNVLLLFLVIVRAFIPFRKLIGPDYRSTLGNHTTDYLT